MKKLLFSLLVLVFSMAMFASAALAGEKTLQFTWEQNISPDFGGWKVYQSLTAGGPYAPLVDSNNNPVIILYEAGQTDFISEQPITAPDGQTTTFYFVFRAFDISQNVASNSNEVSVSIDFEAPDAVFNLTVIVVPD